MPLFLFFLLCFISQGHLLVVMVVVVGFVFKQSSLVPPKIYDISSDMTINEGTNVTLTCLATGKPEPSISWRHISPSAKPFENGQYLDIYGITRDQAGEYECSAENDVSFPDVKKVKVVVNFAPTIQEIKSGTVAPGRSGLIRCEGAGVPPPAFEWYKGEKKLFNGQQGIIIQNFSTRSILTVTNVTQEHFGNYTCVAANKLGTTNASLPLNRKTQPDGTHPIHRGNLDFSPVCVCVCARAHAFIQTTKHLPQKYYTKSSKIRVYRHLVHGKNSSICLSSTSYITPSRLILSLISLTLL
ncbi:unnamed protein product [Nyctereutes procyonoides]|uniref:Neuronal growth regulator 1 n=1 Tax=Nyctereutes procyonoides TaxID=34880 RepID=A0A811Z2M8_NYCPR|nr:unnamed protein product [Nyctereutes procyonoides]